MGDDLIDPTAGAGPPTEPVALALRMAETQPLRALELLARLDAAGGTVAGRVEWARGRAYHQLGRHREASDHLERAVSLLAEAGEAQLTARASVSLALQRIEAARFDDAVTLLETAEAGLSGGEAARASAQKALALQRADRSHDAVAAWDAAVARFEAEGMVAEAAVARQNRGLVHLYREELDAAERDLVRAGRDLLRAGQEIRAAEAEHNLGLVHARRGDLARAFEHFDSAQATGRRLGTERPQALVDRAEVALEAGLIGEGRGLAETAAGRLSDQGVLADLAEACLLAARAGELDGDTAAAARWAARAAALFADQGRPRWRLLADLAGLRAQAAGGVDVSDDLVALADALRGAGWSAPALEAETLAAGLHLAAGRPDRAGRILGHLRGMEAGGSNTARMDLRLAQARHRMAVGDAAGARRAMAAAARAARNLRSTSGSVELQGRSKARGEAVVDAGFALAVLVGDPAVALWGAETVRHPLAAIAPGDPDFDRLLQDLRRVELRLDPPSDNDARAAVGTSSVTGVRPGNPAYAGLRRQQAALEELVRRRARHARQLRRGQLPAGIDPERIRTAFSTVPLIEYAACGERLWAVTASRGSLQVVELASLADARRAVGGLRLALQIALDGDPPSASSQEALAAAGRVTSDLLFAPLGLGRPEQVVIVAEGTVGSVPWSLLPELAASEVSVAPSATWWLDRPGTTGPGGDGRSDRVVVVAGPGLRHAEEEVAAVADVWPGALVLQGPDATVARVLEAIRSAAVVHVAAHGSHRGDHPLLSGIRLHDGNLTGYELSAHRLPAELVVFSCCESGMADTAGGIGLSRLATEVSGVANVLASVAPLADRPVVPLMVEVHRRVAAGARPGRALADARLARGPTWSQPTAAGFVCFGR